VIDLDQRASRQTAHDGQRSVTGARQHRLGRHWIELARECGQATQRAAFIVLESRVVVLEAGQ